MNMGQWEFSLYVRERLDSLRSEMFTGPFTVVAELKHGNTLTIPLLEDKGLTYTMDSGAWHLGSVEIPTNELSRHDIIVALTVYDDDWNSLLVADDVEIPVCPGQTIIVENISMRWFYGKEYIK